MLCRKSPLFRCFRIKLFHSHTVSCAFIFWSLNFAKEQKALKIKEKWICYIMCSMGCRSTWCFLVQSHVPHTTLINVSQNVTRHACGTGEYKNMAYLGGWKSKLILSWWFGYALCRFFINPKSSCNLFYSTTECQLHLGSVSGLERELHKIADITFIYCPTWLHYLRREKTVFPFIGFN